MEWLNDIKDIIYLPLSNYRYNKSFRLRCANLAVARIRKVAFSKEHI